MWCLWLSVEKAVPLVLKTIADWLDANSDYTMKISLYCFDDETTKEYQKYTSYQESSLPDFFVNYLEKFQNRVEIIFKRYIIYLEIFLNRW